MENAQIHIRLDGELHRRAVALAEANGESLNEWCKRAIARQASNEEDHARRMVAALDSSASD